MARYISSPDQEQLTAFIQELLDTYLDSIRQRHRTMISECIDVAKFVQQAILDAAAGETYPASTKIGG